MTARAETSRRQRAREGRGCAGFPKRCRVAREATWQTFAAPLTMASPTATTASDAATPIPKSYAKGVAMTPDPWESCARLEYGGDRSFAWSVQQQVVQTGPDGRAKVEGQLLATLALPQCTAAARAFLCQMLALVGSARSVPALAELLRDASTVEPARVALEAIPGVEATAALRGALSAVQGAAKAGLIGSIAARRDSMARDALVALQASTDEPALVRDAATRALAALSVSR